MGFDLPLHVDTMGAAPGPGVETFLLLHGFGGSTFSWRYWAPALARRGHVVLVDLKGFGSAPHPDDGLYGPHDQADLIQRLIRQRQLRNVTLVGHSLGGGVALLAALALRQDPATRLARLVIVAGAAYPQRLPPFVALARWPRLSGTIFRLLGPERVIRWVLRSIVHDPDAVTRTQVEGYAEPFRNAGVRRATFDAAAQIVPRDLDRIVAEYRSLHVPTLCLWGSEDRVVPSWVGERLATELPQAHLEVIEACGHLPAEERVEESLECLNSFLDAHPLGPELAPESQE